MSTIQNYNLAMDTYDTFGNDTGSYQRATQTIFTNSNLAYYF